VICSGQKQQYKELLRFSNIIKGPSSPITHTISCTICMQTLFELCCLLLRPSFTCHPVGGQAIWPGDMAHTGSKSKMNMNDWDTAFGNFGHQAQ
jgi:hypothetical protein